MNYQIVVFHRNTKTQGNSSVTKVARHRIELSGTDAEKAYNHADHIIKNGFRVKISDTVYDWVSPHAIERIRIKSLDSNAKILNTSFESTDVSDLDDVDILPDV